MAGFFRASPLPSVPVVGIPEGLTFFRDGTLWKEFFARIGCRTVSSGRTTSRILNDGTALCSNETCLPVKVFAGHAKHLAGNCDFLFVPRCVSFCPHEKTCPKLCGLPDEVRMALELPARPLEVVIDFEAGAKKTDESLRVLARRLGKKEAEVRAEFAEIRPGLAAADPPEKPLLRLGTGPAVAVLGHPYMIYDELLSMNLIGKLRARGCRVFTPRDVPRPLRRLRADPFSGRNFYDTGFDILGAARVFAARRDLAGMIYLTPFACGVDSLLTEFIERRLQSGRWVPFLKLTVDEHSGEAGFDTRLEAFLDMLGHTVQKEEGAR